MQKLYFSIAAIRPLMEHARKETDQRFGTMEQVMRMDGTGKENPFIRPGLNWRIDYGVYLYPNSTDDDPEKGFHVYAHGCNPNEDAEFWERGQKLLTPDRFLEHPIGLDWIDYVIGDRDFGFLVVVVLPEDTHDIEWAEEIEDFPK